MPMHAADEGGTRRVGAKPAPYALVADADAGRIGVAVEECSRLLPWRVCIARDGHDAVRIAMQFGAPALLMISLDVPGRTGVSVVEALLRMDDSLAVIAWSAERDLREYAVSSLSRRSIRVLRPTAPAAVLRSCIQAVLRGRDRVESREADEDGPSQSALQRLARRAQQRFGVSGAAVYRKASAPGKYRIAIAWDDDAPMPALPAILPAAVEMAISSGDALLWPDVATEAPSRDQDDAPHAIRSLAVVPIVADGELAGALTVFDAKPEALRDSDLPVLAALAGGAAPANDRRETATAAPIDRSIADLVLRRELARVRRERIAVSVVLFGTHAGQQRTAQELVGTVLARTVRENDLVIRWTESEILLVLTGVAGEVARHVAERVRVAVEMSSSQNVALSGTVIELRPTDSFEVTVARAAERLRDVVSAGQPRIA